MLVVVLLVVDLLPLLLLAVPRHHRAPVTQHQALLTQEVSQLVQDTLELLTTVKLREGSLTATYLGREVDTDTFLLPPSVPLCCGCLLGGVGRGARHAGIS